MASVKTSGASRCTDARAATGLCCWAAAKVASALINASEPRPPMIFLTCASRLDERKPKSKSQSRDHHGSNEDSNQADWVYLSSSRCLHEDESQPNEENQIDQTLCCPIMTGQRLHDGLQGSVRVLCAGQCGIE